MICMSVKQTKSMEVTEKENITSGSIETIPQDIWQKHIFQPYFTHLELIKFKLVCTNFNEWLMFPDVKYPHNHPKTVVGLSLYRNLKLFALGEIVPSSYENQVNKWRNKILEFCKPNVLSDDSENGKSIQKRLMAALEQLDTIESSTIKHSNDFYFLLQGIVFPLGDPLAKYLKDDSIGKELNPIATYRVFNIEMFQCLPFSLTNITSLKFSNKLGVNNSILYHFTNITSLCLHDSFMISDKGLASLANLKSLNLSCNAVITDAGLAPLTNLKALSLVENEKITDEALFFLTNLTFLDLTNNFVISDEIFQFLTNITHLNLNEYITYDLTTLTQLKKLGGCHWSWNM